MSTTTAGADQVVVGSLLVTGSLAVVKKVTEGQPPDVVRVLVGVFIAGTMLTLLAEPAPQLASSLAVLVLVASLIYAGPNVWTAITSRATRGQKSAPGDPGLGGGGGAHRLV